MFSQSSIAKDLSILVVEDHFFMAGLVNQILRGLGGADVELVPNGVKAIDKLEGDLVDLLICDINMEPLNGLQLLAAIRAGHTGAPVDLPIIMLTGHTEDPMIQASQLLKANGFLGKPVSAADLTAEINRVLTANETFQAPPVDKETAFQAIEAARVRLREEERALGLNLAKTNKSDAERQASARSEQRGWIDITGVQIGHVPAEDVVSGSGKKLLSAGTALDNKQVELLRRDAAKLGVTAIRIRG